MAEDRNKENRLGGEYMVQDHDHLSEAGQPKGKAKRGDVRQSEQSQSSARQQGGGEQSSSSQQGGERRRKNR